ncbi:iron ABC transporter permease [Desulfosporosinus sp. BICA1-9]|uniref:FecCD family ABC transporter permease n=1 Tax=Desulfosporosinus sp. BICA1-9 TaxID=1531958 RepID=UPI00054C1B6E|nr:iron ABC transporter permease [Desulfosporosinus sp. BICA1-9]KJS46376.1 MAG: ABC transporter permease [Peptococcaceae bacterium BRH_c23]KJS86491.1 MAG: ABC transporter permease [Desulfosporosinus sp. BICA1-9]HBW35582.1 iron ABC transporter permease [Desulfosporosinus sp.]
MKRKIINVGLILCPIGFVFLSLFIGRYPISIVSIIDMFWSKLTFTTYNLSDIYQTVVWEIRMPRAILGALVGGSLAMSGAAFQGLFRNPLVSSGILGVSSGAGFGAALAILIFNTQTTIYLFAFGFALLAVIISYLIGKVYNTAPTIMLVLGGTIVSSAFAALISFIKYVADPSDKLPAIVFWLMGSLASASLQDLWIAGIPMVIGMGGIWALRWRINVLSMGDRQARSLGINTTLNKGLLVIFATLATAGAVAVSGTIGWVGLIIPHIGRMIVGNDNRLLIPASFSLGASFLILIDLTGRMITGSEIPLSILTALIGAPFFVYLLKITKGKGW